MDPHSGTGTDDAASTAKLWHPAAVAPLIICLLYLWLRIWVHHKSPDRPFDTFPDACPPSRLNGCNRVAEHEPHNNRYNTCLPAPTAASLPYILYPG